MKTLDPGAGRAKARRFRTTHWSLVTAARGGSTPEVQQAALSELCQRYWLPVYAYVRRRGYPASDAEDLTQDFFAEILENDLLSAADRERGRFRSFLVGCLRNFLANNWRREQRQRRRPEGGWVPLDVARAERQLDQAIDHTDPETLYLRCWAAEVLSRAEIRLYDEYRERGKDAVFHLLRAFLAVDADQAEYRVVAQELDTPEIHVRVQVSRMRKRLRDLVKEEVGETLASPRDLDPEIRTLRSALLGQPAG